MTHLFTPDAAGALPGPDWLRSRRRAAAERFAGLDLPSADAEEWRYSRIGTLDLGRFHPGADDPADLPAAVADAVSGVAGDVAVVVSTNGRAIVRNAGSATIRTGDDLAEGDVGTLAADGAESLLALHEAFAEPVVVDVPEGTDAGTILVVHAAHGDGVASFPRLTVSLGQAASATVVEVFTSADGTGSLGVPVTELVVGRDARLGHTGIQVLGDTSWQLGRIVARVDQGGRLDAGAAAFGGDYARLRTDVTLAGRGAHAGIAAAYFGDRTQLLDFRTFQDHAAPDTTSDLLYKGALGQKGASVYTGLIKIRPGARGSRAFQTNRNVKLSEDAWAESVPNLEIENNEVQCSHASTVGPIDPEQRFYLESRGVPTARAERLIVRGFFDEVLDRVATGPFDGLARAAMEQSLERSMP